MITAKIELPDSLAGVIEKALREEVARKSAALAKEVEAGCRWVKINEAVQITGRTRREIRAAAEARTLAHYIEKGQPKFRLKDLWEWMDLKRVEAKRD